MLNPPPESDPLRQQPTKGTLIEVSSGEESFRGAWYLATVLQSSPKSISTKRNRPLVRYKTLLAEDGSSPLTEYVDPAFIRPLPPNDKEDGHSCFEVNEVVDARYRDGWWTGIVRNVLDKSKYRVYFDNPSDVIEFDRKDLRVHWDWVDGKWLLPEKQQSTGSIFSSGTAVEVNTGDENLGDVWFPAIVIKENGDTTFLVKHQSSKNDDEPGTVKVVVHSLHIRPSSPRYAERNYELLERVDTTYNFGWRRGVITKVLPGRRYNVVFKLGNEKELSHSDIRPNVEWIDGKWEVLIASDEQELVGNVLPGTHCTEVAGEHESSFSRKDSAEDKNCLSKQQTPSDEKNARFTKKTAGDQPCAKTESSLTEATTQTASNGHLFCQRHRSNRKAKKQKVEGEVKTKEVDMPIISALTAKFTKTSREKKYFLISDLLKSVNDSVGNKNTEIREHKVDVNQNGKRGRSRKSVVTSPKAFVSASQDASTGRTGDDPKTKEVHLPSAGISNMVDEDQPLSIWIVGIHSSGDEDSRLPSGKLVDQWNEERLVDVPVESLAMDARSGSPMDVDWSLPFVKKSCLWQTIESMDVFQIVPQKPHFQPLAENREEFREGSAIGIMVTFASLFEKISTLRFDDPRDTFDSIFESLSCLEKHGFDVTLLRCRLNKLLSIKEGEGKHIGERENTEREMIENTEEITKLDEEMKEIKKKISELQERHAIIKSEEEAKNLKISGLKLHVDVLNEHVQNNWRDFKKFATAPWKSP